MARMRTLKPQFFLNEMFGNRGTGKTHLLAALANELMARGETPLYVVVPDFLEYLRAGYDSETLDEKASRRMEDAPQLSGAAAG